MHAALSLLPRCTPRIGSGRLSCLGGASAVASEMLLLLVQTRCFLCWQQSSPDPATAAADGYFPLLAIEEVLTVPLLLQRKAFLMLATGWSWRHCMTSCTARDRLHRWPCMRHTRTDWRGTKTRVTLPYTRNTARSAFFLHNPALMPHQCQYAFSDKCLQRLHSTPCIYARHCQPWTRLLLLVASAATLLVALPTGGGYNCRPCCSCGSRPRGLTSHSPQPPPPTPWFALAIPGGEA